MEFSVDYSTKPIPCPDGLIRMITLDNWYWNNLDWLVDQGHETRKSLIAEAWENASWTPDDFESAFKDQLCDSIYYSMRHRFPGVQNVHNDNNIGVADTKSLFSAIINKSKLDKKILESHITLVCRTFFLHTRPAGFSATHYEPLMQILLAAFPDSLANDNDIPLKLV